MKIFGYGSLLCIDSLQSTAPEAHIEKISELKGYKRVFNLASQYRINEKTGIPSCVLNIEPDESSVIRGVIIHINDEHIDLLREREKGYDELVITPEENMVAITFKAKFFRPYTYQYGDPVQNEYLDICLEAAKRLEIEKNFLETTFIGKKSLSEIGVENILSQNKTT
jgi:hypothetical protein